MNRVLRKIVLLGKTMDSPDIGDLVETLTFTESVKKHNTLELRFSNFNAEQVQNNEAFYEGAPVICSFGFVEGEMSKPRLCVIADIEPDYAGGQGMTLTVKCIDKGISFKKGTSDKIWKNITTKGILEEICKAHGLTLNIEEPAAGFNTYISLPQSDMTDMQFIRQLARMQKPGNYFVSIQDNVLNFITRGTGNASVETVVIGNNPNVVRFSPRYKESSAGSEASGVSATDGLTGNSANPHSEDGGKRLQEHTLVTANGQIFVEKADGTRPPAFRKNVYQVGDKQYVEITTDNQGRVVYANPNVPNKPEAAVTKNLAGEVAGYISNFVQGKTNIADNPVLDDITGPVVNHDYKQERDKVLTATLIEYGNPSRTANSVITIEGEKVYRKYVGNWYITEVVHDFLIGGYSTRSTLSKDGLGGKGLVKSKEVNDTVGEPQPVVLINAEVPGISAPVNVTTGSNLKTGEKAKTTPGTKTRFDK